MNDLRVRGTSILFILIGFIIHLFREQGGTLQFGMETKSLKTGSQSIFPGSKLHLYPQAMQGAPLISSPIHPRPQVVKAADTDVLYGLLPIPPNPTHRVRALASLNGLIKHLGEGKGKAPGKFVLCLH